MSPLIELLNKFKGDYIVPYCHVYLYAKIIYNEHIQYSTYDGLFYFRAAVYASRADKNAQLLQPADVIMTSAEELSSNAKPLFRKLQKIPKKIKKIIASLPHQEVCFSSFFSLNLMIYFINFI